MAPGQIYVNIFGTDYSLVSEGNDEYLKSIARYLDDKMREIDRSQNLKSVSKVAILAALNIVEELFQEREYRGKLISEINEEARNMNNSISELLENH
jgi:cell division protein ZapA